MAVEKQQSYQTLPTEVDRAAANAPTTLAEHVSSEAIPDGQVDLDRAVPRRRPLVLWLTSGSHAVDHFQQQTVAVLYPAIMAELGFGYAQLGVLTAIRTLLGSGCQVIYGFLVPFFRRTRLLAAGNLISWLGGMLTGLAGSYGALIGARVLFSAGSSAQHPIGSTLLASSYAKNRGTVLALNSSIAGIGSLLAPIVAGLLLALLNWRQIFMLVALASLGAGLACLLLPDRGRTSDRRPRAARARLAQGKASYLRVLRNRNMLVVSSVMMVGAAGRGDGVNQTYLGPHLMNDLLLPAAVAGIALSALMLGNIGGSIGLGWLSDRLGRIRVMQASLLLSALTTWWLAYQGADLSILLVNLLVYGAVTGSRNALTQALIADSLHEDRDAAFSTYYFLGFISTPIWALVTGFIMESAGFSAAFSVLGFSYLAGMLLLFLLEDTRATANP